MPVIVIVNGPPGVGKSTVSRCLANVRPGTVCIHGDHLRAFAPEDARAHLGGGSTYRAGATLACTYVEMGAARVIFDYCFLRPQHLRYFAEQIPRNVPMHLVTLWASLPTVQARERGRVGRTPLGDAVEECHAELQGHLSEFGTVMDAESEAPEVIAAAIAARLDGSSSG